MSEQHSQNRVTYFTAAVMNLCIWLPAYYMRSPVGEFMSVCEEREREGETASSHESSQILIGRRVCVHRMHHVSARVNMI